MNYTYIIMTEDNYYNGRYYPCSSGYAVLKKMSRTPEELKYIEQVEKENIGFAYNMIYIMQQSCGHYEVFQTHVTSKIEAIAWLKQMKIESSKRRCTRCTCLRA